MIVPGSTQNSIEQQCSPTLLEHFPPSQDRWNTNYELVQLLESARFRAEWISNRVKERPPSGSQLLFHRQDGAYFKSDGYEWKKRKEGRLIREDHMKLKVQKKEVISANYSHSAVVPTFHRRVYWLTSNPDLVLVHYLNCPEDDQNGGSFVDKMANLMRSCKLTLSHGQLFAQAFPILSNRLSAQQVKSLCAEVLRIVNDSTHLAAPHSLSRRNSCSSASRRGLSSLALARQPSAFSDSLDPNFLGAVESNCGLEMAVEDSRSHSGVTDGVTDGVADGETHRSEEDAMLSDWSRPSQGGVASEWTAPSVDEACSSATTTVCPNKATVAGGETVLVVGGWYLRGHEYAVHLGDVVVPATLLQVGVLQIKAPAVASPRRVSLRVSCDDSIVSSPVPFFFTDSHRDDTKLLMQSLVDRISVVVSSFGLTEVPRCSLDECGLLRVLHSLKGRQLLFPQLLSSALPSRTILHCAAALDFSSIIEYVLFWRTDVPCVKEFNPMSEDAEGKTAMDIAIARGHIRSARALVRPLNEKGNVDPALVDSLVRMNSTSSQGPSTGLPRYSEDVDHATSTALWVLTNGETVTGGDTLIREKETNEGEGERYQKAPLEISMDTDVHVPDSPDMAHLFHAVISPGIVDGGTRCRMAILAQQIIHALPERIKQSQTDMQYVDEIADMYNHQQQPVNFFHDYHQWDHQPSYYMPMRVDNDNMSYTNHASTLSSYDADLEETGLGEFFNIDTEGEVDPLQQKLGDIKLTDEEQKKVYEAALLMQRSCQENEHDNDQRTETERRAALTIQNFYRRYKQFCYVRRLHNAAVVVQKHFRLRRVNQKEGEGGCNDVPEHPSIEGQSICIQVPNSSLQREHRAAATIQNAYRGHRKRQAAARLIQKFMRQTRQKLRKTQVENEGVSSGIT